MDELPLVTRWTKSKINQAKRAVREELEVVNPVVGSPDRLKHCLQKIKGLEDDLSPEARLYCLIYLMSALVQHQRRPGLTDSQVSGLVERAHGILLLQGIRPGVSRQSFLFGELHQVISLIERRKGRQWRSAWEQQMATYLAKPAPEGVAGFDALARAQRLLRLGWADGARAAYREALENELSESQRELAQIGLARTQRLGGCLDDAAHAIEDAKGANFSPGGMRELEWESLCLQAMQSRDYVNLRKATHTQGSHYQASYIVESYLWTASSSEKSAIELHTRMRTLARKKDVRMTRLGDFFRAARKIEDCYDSEIPVPVRLRDLGEVLNVTRGLVNVDKELLVWSAAARWLVRIHSFHLAFLALKEYEAISLRLTNGRMRDVLGCVHDLIDASWFRSSDIRSSDIRSSDIRSAEVPNSERDVR